MMMQLSQKKAEIISSRIIFHPYAKCRLADGNLNFHYVVRLADKRKVIIQKLKLRNIV